jgi:hypothetical protein
MKKSAFFIFTLLTCILSSSCNSLFYFAYGIHQPKVLNAKSIKKHSKKYGIPETESYELDTLFYTYLKSLDHIASEQQINDHGQALQAFYYNQSKQLISYHVNCYAGGFPNLNWNQGGIFEKFPPKTLTPIDSLLPFNQLKTYLIPTTGYQKNSSKTYTVVVFWSRFMGRQSKRLIKLVKENAKGVNAEEIEWYFVNNDNFLFNLLK